MRPRQKHSHKSLPLNHSLGSNFPLCVHCSDLYIPLLYCNRTQPHTIQEPQVRKHLNLFCNVLKAICNFLSLKSEINHDFGLLEGTKLAEIYGPWFRRLKLTSLFCYETRLTYSCSGTRAFLENGARAEC